MERGFVDTIIQQDGIAVVTFSHPAHNALPARLLEQLSDQISGAGENPDVSVIVLQSAGDGTYCAGAYFDELLSIRDEHAGTAFFSGFANVINAMRKSPKLIVGRVQGKAVGGGVGLIATCDYCFATEKAAVKLSEISISIGPFVIAPAVERKAGVAAFTELALNPGKFFDTQWAVRHGLIQEVFPTTGTMDDGIRVFCKQLLGANPEALTAFKRTLWRGTDHWDRLLYEQAAVSGRLAISNETRQLLRAFKSK